MIKRFYISAILVSLFLCLVIPEAVEASTVGLWLFDEGSGDYAYDSSGYGNTGALVNGPTWTADHPSPNASFNYGGNYALSFDGINDYVEANCSSGSSLNLTDAVTIEAWVNSSQAGYYDYIIAKYYNGSMASYALDTDSSNARFYVTTGGSFHEVTSNYNLWDGNWHHIAGSYDKDAGANNIKLYIDGGLVTSGTTSGQMNIADNMNLYIGSYGTGTSFNFPGKIDEVRVSNAALGSSQLGYHGSLVPEPASMILFGIGALGLGFSRRKKIFKY